MKGNQSFFSQLSLSDSLPFVTLADGSQIKVCGSGQTHPLPNLPLNSVLFVPSCPFNLISISKVTHSLNFFVLLLILFLCRIGVPNGRLEQDMSLGDCIIFNHRLPVYPLLLPILLINKYGTYEQSLKYSKYSSFPATPTCW